MTTPALSPLRRVFRDQRILWWIFGVSLILAWLGSLPARSAFGDILDHSKAAARLVHGFDASAFAELMNMPEVPSGLLFTATSAHYVVLFVFLLFLSGGTYAAFHAEERLTTATFFQACGGLFWRMTRLLLVSLIPFGLLAAGMAILNAVSTGLESSPNERTSDYVFWAGCAVLGLLAIGVRLWFDLSQARTAILNERGMFKTALRTFRSLSVRLYATYVGLVLLRIALAAAVVKLWMGVAPEATFTSFLLIEFIILTHVFTRLWQRAVSVRAMEQLV